MQSIASATRYLKSQDNTASDSEWPWQIRNTSGPNKAPEPQTSLFRTPWTCQVWRVVIFRVPFAKFWQMSLFSQARVEIASLRTILNIQKKQEMTLILTCANLDLLGRVKSMLWEFQTRHVHGNPLFRSAVSTRQADTSQGRRIFESQAESCCQVQVRNLPIKQCNQSLKRYKKILSSLYLISKPCVPKTT